MFSRVPFVGFVLFFMTGILFDDYLLTSFENSQLFLIPILILAGAISVFFYSKSNSRIGAAFSFFLFTSGVLASNLQNKQLNSELNLLAKTEYSSYEAVVKTLPEKRPKSIRMEILVNRILVGTSWVDKKVKAVISIPIDAQFVPKAGDYLVVNGNLDRPGKALNPEEFDYQRYLWNKGFVWTDYLPDNSYQILPSQNHSSRPATWSISMSQWADSSFRANIKDDKSYGLVKAMLLGRRDDLGTEQVDDYTASGTVHILSVSGMHVAIIFIVISFSLAWLKRWQIGKFVYLFTVILMLCFYALVTGLPPSVQRATLMCIVFVVAEAFGRKQSAMNTLAISALLILVVDPRALYDVGFQLSFLAMTGIFILYQPIHLIYQPSNRILKFSWNVTAMAFAAQLATFPLSLFYFHQFPTYFWLVNPFVILFTNVLLPASMALLLVSLLHFSWLQIIANSFVEFSAWLTNISVAVPKVLPGYLIENLYLDRIEVVLLYAFIGIMWYSYDRQEYLFLRRSFGIVLLLVIYSFSQSIQTFYSSRAIVHSLPKHSVISFKEGNRLFISSDDAFKSDTIAYKFHIKNYAISQGILKVTYLSGSEDYLSGSLAVKSLRIGRLLLWDNLLIGHGVAAHSHSPIDYALITSPIHSSKENSLNFETTYLLGGEIRGRKLKNSKEYLSEGKNKFYDLSDGFLLLH